MKNYIIHTRKIISYILNFQKEFKRKIIKYLIDKNNFIVDKICFAIYLMKRKFKYYPSVKNI